MHKRNAKKGKNVKVLTKFLLFANGSENNADTIVVIFGERYV